jgi:hypothetical protein
MKQLLFALLFTVAAHAQTFLIDFTPAANYTTTSTVSVGSDLILSTPGTYTAASWRVGFGLKLQAAGEYVLVSTVGLLTIGFDIQGPAVGTAKITLISASQIQVSGNISPNVTIVQSAAVTNPPPVLPIGIRPPAGTAGAAPLVNISTRVTLAEGQSVTPGFVVGGTAQRRVLVRAVGPSLITFGVAGAAKAPTLTVFDGKGAQIGANAGWGGSMDMETLFAGVGAFALVQGSADAAVVLTLAPGNYTARVSGAGEVLVEIYFVD